MASSLPDFTAHGYRAEVRLGSNPEGGRTSWRAVELATGRQVVIKRFSFASGDASWDGYDAHKREIRTLRDLEHPRIPAWVADFETPDGFCLVQVWCDARPMSARVSWSVDEVLTLARSALEVLDYLGRRLPPVVHRDIKPENLLVDDAEQVHLVDFGLARADRADNTTVASGTPGFMPPEQFLGRRVVPATDLYGLGATLMCALTGTPSHRAGDLVGATLAFDLSRLPSSVDGRLRDWVGRMVAPAVEERFATAADALRALDSMATSPPPSARVVASASPQPTELPTSYDEGFVAWSERPGQEPNRSANGEWPGDHAPPPAPLFDLSLVLALFALLVVVALGVGLFFSLQESGGTAPAQTTAREKPVTRHDAPEIGGADPASIGSTIEFEAGAELDPTHAKTACESVSSCVDDPPHPVFLRLELDRYGRVSASEVVGDPLSTEVSSCVGRALKQLRVEPDGENPRRLLTCKYTAR